MRIRNKMGKILGVAIVCLMIGTMVWGAVSAEQQYYATKEEAVSHVPTHVVPKDCFVWKDGPDPAKPWRVIPGTGCAHWVAHELGLGISSPWQRWERGEIEPPLPPEAWEVCYDGFYIRVADVIHGRTEVEIKDAELGDIWTNEDHTHCGIVRQVGTDKVLVEHDSSEEGGVVETWFSLGKCWHLTDSDKQQLILEMVNRHRNDGGNAWPAEVILAMIFQEGGEGAFHTSGDYYAYNNYKYGPWTEPDNTWEHPERGFFSDGIMQVTEASNYAGDSGYGYGYNGYTNDQMGYEAGIDDGIAYLDANYASYKGYINAIIHYNTGPNTIWIYKNGMGDPHYLAHVANKLSTRVPSMYGFSNQAWVDALDAGQQIVDEMLAKLPEGKSVEYYKPYQDELDWRLRNIILFDDTHDTDNDELTGNYLKLKTALENARYRIVELNTGSLTFDTIKPYGILILPDVETELSETEVKGMTNYLNNGGRILIIGEWKGAHLPLSVSKISEVMGIEFQETILNDTTNFYESTGWPIIHNMDTSHPIGNGISSFAMYAGSSLGFTSDTPKAIAWGDDDTIAEDPVGDGSAPDNEFTPQVQKEVKAKSFSQGINIIVLASSKFPVSGGEAKIVCIGDSDLWKTTTAWEWPDYDPIENYDNKKLLLNIINWLASPAPPQEPTTNFGTVSQGEMSTFTISVPETAKQLNIELTWPGSDLDLHLYDPQGRHVGYNYTTDQEEIEIPRATYSGRTAKPEWINVTLSSQSGEWTVGVYGYQVEGAYEFYKTESLTDITPPTISNVRHLPSSPTEQDTVNVYADVTDDVAVQSVTCHWTVDFVNWATITMSKQSSTYKTDSAIPSHPTGTTVYYYIKATDTSGHEATDPIDAPISTHSYGVTAIVPARVPALTPLGIIALAGLLTVIAISKIRRRAN